MTEPTDQWPIPENATVVAERDTLAGTPAPPPADRRIGAGMLLALAALLVVAAGIAAAWLLTHRDTNARVTTVVVRTAPRKNAVLKVAVPRVVGLDEPAARARLAEAGLRPKEVYRPTREPKGVVVSQRPQEAKEVAKGTRVTLVIDAGAPKVAVPAVLGKTVSDAQATLDRLGLDATLTPVTSTQPAGTVVDMAPKPGAKVAKGSVVTLSVAKAPAQQTTTQQTTAPETTAQQTTTAPAEPANATVPDVGGRDEVSAVQAFGDAGILASLFFVPGTDPLGTVVGQAKPAGTSVPFHAHVQINVSSGPGDKPKESVPNVVGKTLDQAVAAMNGAHLRLIYLRYPVTSPGQAGKIVQQSPLGGGSAPQNAQVLVFLGALQKQ